MAASSLLKRPALVLLPLLGVFVVAMLVLPSREGWAGDEPEYLNLAGNITHGFYREGSPDGPLDMCLPGWQYPDLWYGPGFPALLAPLVALHLPVGVIRLVGPLLLFVSLLLFYRLLRLSVRQGVALAGAAALGLYVPFYRYLPHLHSEFLALAIVIAAMYATIVHLRSGSRLALGAAGALLAWLALTRVAYGWVLTILFVVWLAWWLVRRSSTARGLALTYGLALVLCVPWLVYTYSVSERPFYWGSSGGLSLYWMSSPEPGDLGDWHCANDVFSDSALAPHRAFFLANRSKPPFDQDRELERRALRNVVDHPTKFARNLAANASRLFFNTPYSRRDETVGTLAFLLPSSLLLGLLFFSGTFLVTDRRRVPPEVPAFVAFAAVALALHVTLSAFPRMLIPIVPLLLWLVVYVLGTRLRSPEPAGG